LRRSRYSEKRLTTALNALLSDHGVAERAGAVSALINQEDGASSAARAVLARLRRGAGVGASA
jgi:UDP:flavonoid glycosyltransferase YjiC (YdhE family)